MPHLRVMHERGKQSRAGRRALPGDAQQSPSASSARCVWHAGRRFGLRKPLATPQTPCVGALRCVQDTSRGLDAAMRHAFAGLRSSTTSGGARPPPRPVLPVRAPGCTAGRARCLRCGATEFRAALWWVWRIELRVRLAGSLDRVDGIDMAEPEQRPAHPPTPVFEGAERVRLSGPADGATCSARWNLGCGGRAKSLRAAGGVDRAPALPSLLRAGNGGRPVEPWSPMHRRPPARCVRAAPAHTHAPRRGGSVPNCATAPSR